MALDGQAVRDVPLDKRPGSMNQQNQPIPQQQFEYFRTKPDGDIDPAGEAGWYLQRERETKGISLEQASAACGVHASHIEGIEMGDLTQLPPRSEALRGHCPPARR